MVGYTIGSGCISGEHQREMGTIKLNVMGHMTLIEQLRGVVELQGIMQVMLWLVLFVI